MSLNTTTTTINVEVGAYLYERAVVTTLGYPSMGFGGSSKEGQAYQDAFSNLLFGGRWEQASYNQAVNNFKMGATANQSKIYNDFRVKLNDTNPVIKKFFPLIR